MSGQIIEKCRACGSRALSPAFTLGGDNAYIVCDTKKEPVGCGLLQRATQSPKKIVRSDVAVPANRMHRHRLRAIVTSVMEMVTTRDGRALDIGCGDGTLLSLYPRWIEAIGVDIFSSKNTAPHFDKYIRGVFPDESVSEEINLHTAGEKFDVITAISVLGDIADPVKFLRAVRDQLTEDGVFVLETSYLSLALMRNEIGAFHEQAQSLYALSVLERIVKLADMKIIRGGMSETDGGSLRLYITHDAYCGYDYVPWLEKLARLWDEESVLNLTGRQTYQAFSHRIETNRKEIERVLDSIQKYEEHAVIVGMDAATEALLNWVDIGDNIVSAIAVEDQQYTSQELVLEDGSTIDIISPEDAKTSQPDYLIASTQNRREVLEHWRGLIYDGTQIIFFTPELEIIDNENYGAALGRCLAVTDAPGSLDTLKAVLSTIHRPKLIIASSA